MKTLEELKAVREKMEKKFPSELMAVHLQNMKNTFLSVAVLAVLLQVLQRL